MSEQSITPYAMAYLTVVGKTPDGHTRYATNACNFFDETEIAAIRDSAEILGRFFTHLDRLQGVEDAYQEFKDELKNLNREDQKSLHTVDRRFRAFILEWKLFLDHYGCFIENGAQTIYWKTVKAEDKEEYQQTFRRFYSDIMNPSLQSEAFNVAIAIRNYVQHANNSVDFTDWKTVFIDRNKLLGRSRIKKEQRKALEAQPEKINLENIAESALVEIKKIHERILTFMLDSETASAATTLLKAYERITNKGINADRWMIFTLTPCELIDAETGKSIYDTQDEEDSIPYDPATGKPKHNYQARMNMVYIPLNWSAYVAFASFLIGQWQQATWKELRDKYFGEDV